MATLQDRSIVDSVRPVFVTRISVIISVDDKIITSNTKDHVKTTACKMRLDFFK